MTSSLTTSADALLICETTDGVATLTLNRPGQFNALSSALIDEMQSMLIRAATDPGIRVVVLAARGRGFCAGHDLKEIRAMADVAEVEALFARCSRMMMTLTRLPQPVIAKVHGLATAAGCQLVASCDLAVASAAATFATPGVNIGAFCATPSVALGRAVGRMHAMEMLLTGDMISAEEAKRIGLINQVVAPGTERDEAIALARRIAAKSTATVKIGKQAFYAQLEMPLAEAYRHASAVMVENMMLRDSAEGIGAFLDKREPKWEDR